MRIETLDLVTLPFVDFSRHNVIMMKITLRDRYIAFLKNLVGTHIVVKPFEKNALNLFCYIVVHAHVVGCTMIDEDRTLQLYGYVSTDLKPRSAKPVISVCDECGAYRVVRRQSCRELCRVCVQIGKHRSPETRKKMVEAAENMSDEKKKRRNPLGRGHKHTPESIKKISDAKMGHTVSDDGRLNMSNAQKKRFAKQSERDKARLGTIKFFAESPEARERASAKTLGIPYEEWDGFAEEHEYCHRFNEPCRESNRDKYGRDCFICGKPESKNMLSSGKNIKLSVHHVDMNKQQGCDDHDWNLIPLCASCHARVHNKPWQARIEYMLQENQ